MLKLILLILIAYVAIVHTASAPAPTNVIPSTASNYSHDGTNNNLKNPNWGKTGNPLARIVPTVYDDNIGSPVGGIPSRLPSTRLISNLIFGREAAGIRKTNPRLVTDMLTFWGQFVDHDLNHSPDSGSTVPCDPFKIPVPTGDPFYDVTATGNATMNFCRTIPIDGTGTSINNKRQLPNTVNSWIDGSNVYGNTKAWADALRTFKDGKMKTSTGPDGPLLPINDDGKGNPLVAMNNPAKRVPANTLFAAGDERANENPILTCLHTLFVREHNRRASLLPQAWTDEQKYQEARRFVIGHIQAITFNEYLPTLIGRKVPAYAYNDSLNPQISAFFSTVAFRYGHDEVSGIIKRYGKNGLPYKDGNLLLRDAYFFPDVVKKVGIDAYLRGAAVNQQNAVDAQIDEDMRTFLFNQAPALATDLAARNMQRARDHGIARYNDCRVAYGLKPCSNFACVTNDTNIIKLLNQAYGTDNVTFLDPYIGGLLEAKLPGSNLGELFTVSILEQLVRTRNADRFWYQKQGIFTRDERETLDDTKLSDIISRNADIPTLPRDIFTRKNISPDVALGATGDNTKLIIAIIIPSVVAAVLIIIVIGMCFTNKKNNRVMTDYEHFEDK